MQNEEREVTLIGAQYSVDLCTRLITQLLENPQGFGQDPYGASPYGQAYGGYGQQQQQLQQPQQFSPYGMPGAGYGVPAYPPYAAASHEPATSSQHASHPTYDPYAAQPRQHSQQQPHQGLQAQHQQQPQHQQHQAGVPPGLGQQAAGAGQQQQAEYYAQYAQYYQQQQENPGEARPHYQQQHGFQHQTGQPRY